MFEQCHSAHDVAHVYRSMGFDASLIFHRVALIASNSLGAVAMPAALGADVRRALTNRPRAIDAPIISFHRPDREWVYLVGPGVGRSLGRTTRDMFDTAGVRIMMSGQRVWLPMSDSVTQWYWVSPPSHARALPSRTAVLTTTRHLLHLPSHSSVRR